MRILKRNLAFMLAMIMALSLTAFAGYEDYPDVDELTYVEAVDVLTELGIVEGSNGKLLPTENLTRAQATKLIAYTMLGKKAADALQADTATFVDVPTYHWAAGYVEYCADQGIVGGVGNGQFLPEKNVTASEFAKMLLCAVGYGENGEFTGASWAATVNALATKLGVFDKNLDVVFADAATREEAFLYTFNALTKVMAVTYSADADDYYAGNVFNPIKGFDAKETLGYKLYNLKKVDGVKDAFGRDSYNWYKGSKKIAGLYADAPAAVYTTKVKGNTIYADLDLTATTNATVYKNGVKQANFQLKSGLKNDLPNSGNGVLVEAYVVDEQVTLIMVETFLAQVKAVNSKDNEVTLNVFRDADTVDTYNDIVVDMELAKNDYVLVTVDDKNDEIVTVAIPETVEGQLDNHGHKSTYTTMAGTKYNHSFNLIQEEPTYVVAFETDMIMIMDEYGYMIGLVKADTAAKLEGYVLVKASQGAAAETFLEKATVKAEVMYMATGETEIVNLATKLNGTGLSRTAQYWNPAKAGGAGWSPVVAESFIVDYGFYGYYMDGNGEMRLLPLNAEGRKEAQVLSVAQTLGKTDMNAWGYEADAVVKNDAKTEKFTFGTAANTLKINSATTLHLVSKDGVESIEGYKNFEIAETDVDALVVYKANSNYVTDIYVVNGDLHSNVVGYYNADEHMIDVNGRWITLYVGGEEQTYKLTADTKLYYDVLASNGVIYKSTTAETLNVATLPSGAYKFTLDGNTLETLTLVSCGKWSSGKAEDMQIVDLGTNWIETAVIKNTTHSFMEDHMGRKYTLADDVQIYDVTNGGVETSLDLNDRVVIVIDRDATNMTGFSTAGTQTVVINYVYVVGHVDNQVVTPDTQAAVAFTKNGNTWRFDFANLKKDDVVAITAYNYAEGIDGIYAAYSFTQAADGANGFQQTYNVDAQMSFVVTINGTLVFDGPVYSFVQ